MDVHPPDPIDPIAHPDGDADSIEEVGFHQSLETRRNIHSVIP